MRLLPATLLLLATLAAGPATAQETRSAPPGHQPPPAQVAQLGWLAGSWVGEGIDGAPASETYSAPAGGIVAGHFVQTDGAGSVAFMEVVQIAQAGESLVYRLKHFGADLTGWEDKEQVVSFPLVAAEDGALYFDGLTLRRDGPDGLLSAVLVRGDDGTTQEYVFRYRRTAGG
ncbi:hypothetical protein PK98_11665 [Croceibacterium mercuriale]|uniref:DUF6265 domain-containing protein n=1 Tax=Croceibacterium mercuriale TaxID=1572751 RepID=A0A0B2BX98_9SPHN|nr:DUF6265 family protein [Croceibacterium mercuriale]KHL24622.1 hypothetical protein PK98_11665 [Croceibacterium mercuriale]